MNRCGVSQAFDPGGVDGQASAVSQFDAIWDTGATHSVISESVIAACGLAPTGITQVHGVHGTAESETYLVNIYLPNSVLVSAVKVTKGMLTGADILIGMDIISLGDFAVTNHGGITKFSFRIPSEVHIDFVEEHRKTYTADGTRLNRAMRRANKRR